MLFIVLGRFVHHNLTLMFFISGCALCPEVCRANCHGVFSLTEQCFQKNNIYLLKNKCDDWSMTVDCCYNLIFAVQFGIICGQYSFLLLMFLFHPLPSISLQRVGSCRYLIKPVIRRRPKIRAVDLDS